MQNNDFELLKIKVDIWKTIIGTQQHFNEISMKIKNFAIVLLSAFLGFIGVIMKEKFSDLNIGLFFFIASFIWILIYIVDMWWYQPMLIGAVKQAENIEREIGEELKDVIKLTQTISAYSHQKCASKYKARIFYFGILVLLIVLGFIFIGKHFFSSYTC